MKIEHLPDRPTITIEMDGLICMRYNGLAIWYSWETPIAFQLKINPPVARKNETRASDHYKRLGVPRHQWVPGDQFNSRLKYLLEEYWVR